MPSDDEQSPAYDGSSRVPTRVTIERGHAPSARELVLRAELIQVRHELRMLLEDLERVRSERPLPTQSAVVTHVVSKTALMQQRTQPRMHERGD